MANIKSSKKDIRRTKRRRIANSQNRSRLRTLDKKIRLLLEEGSSAEAASEFKIYSSYLDRAGKRNLIHQKQADRRKGRIAVLLGSPAAAPAPAAEKIQQETAESTSV